MRNREMDEEGMRQEVCPECESVWIEGDKYCRFCGAQMKGSKFIPARFSSIYGPMPVDRTHRCVSCGHEWVTCLMADSEKYCPRCGGEAPVIKVSER